MDATGRSSALLTYNERIASSGGFTALFDGLHPLTSVVATDDAFSRFGYPEQARSERDAIPAQDAAGRREVPEIVSALRSLPTLGGGMVDFSSNGTSNLAFGWSSAAAGAAVIAAWNGLLYPLLRIFVV